MIDIHCHVLPGIDDGVKTMEECVEFCRMAREGGTRTIIATPHMKEGAYSNEREKVLERVAELNERLERESVELRILPGSEVYFDAGLVEGIREGRLATLADGRSYLLLELSFTQSPVKLEETLFELKVAGITTVLAHPERIRYFQEDLERLDRAVRMGALSQVTSSSLTGRFGGKVKGISEEMVRRGLVHLVASDAHDLKYRPPRIGSAAKRLAELAGEQAASNAVEGFPQRIVEGLSIEPPEPARDGGGSSRSALSRLWGRLTSR